MIRGGFKPTRCYDLCTPIALNCCSAAEATWHSQKARGHRDIRTTLVYTQVVVDPRLADAVNRAFTIHRVAASRGSTGK